MAPSAAPHLRFVFRIVAEVGPYLPLQKRDVELLEFIPITGGTIEGEIVGSVVAGGGDWCVTRADDAYDVEARYLIRTDDDQVVDVVNVGIVRHLPGESGDDMGYFQSTPRFRTTARDLQWLTRSVFVGRGVSNEHNTTIDVFEVQA